MICNYNNKFGSLELEVITDFKPVNTFRCKDLPDEIKFSIDVAERIALITDNRVLQCFPESGNLNKWSVMVHKGKNGCLAAVCKVNHINYIGGSPTEEFIKGRTYYLDSTILNHIL